MNKDTYNPIVVVVAAAAALMYLCSQSFSFNTLFTKDSHITMKIHLEVYNFFMQEKTIIRNNM